MRTLLVEDDPGQREKLTKQLTELGLDVTAVRDAAAGLVEHLRAAFDLLVIDWVMPGMDGLQLCTRVRALPGGDHPYVIVVTGRDRPSDLTEVLDAGADDYVAKPVDSGLLLTRIRIAQRRVASDARHREAREALARSEADFRRVVERSPLGVFAHRDGKIVYVNAVACRTFGLPGSELLGAEFAKFVREEFREVASRRAARFERTQVPPPPMEMEIERAGGERASVRLIPATSTVYQGARACFTILEDVTERQRAERELRMTQYAVDRAADAAVWVKHDGRIFYANEAACKMTGYTTVQLLGRHIAELDAAGGVDDFERFRATEVGTASEVRRQTRWRRRDRSEVSVEVLINLVEFDGERLFISFARDLTERNRLEASLQQADRLASVGSLAAGVAHEINNPLAYVIANLELLAEDIGVLEGALDKHARLEFEQTLREATEGAHRVRRIVGDLKSFARAGDDEEPKAVDVEDVLEAAIDIAANEIRHRARLCREYADVPPTWGNGGRLTQVFLNLLVNAAHAIPEGDDASGAGRREDRREHRIFVRTREASNGWISVEIEDTGVGMQPEIVDRIFDPFFTTKPQGMGTGLGLSICHGIVTAMGGEISVRSEEGCGTTFTLTLPPAEGDLRRARPRTWPDMSIDGARRLRILVVDDEPLICEGIRRALSGHDVEVAPSGRDAVRICEDGEFDLVLCDVMMPDVSGMEVYARIRAAKPEYEARFVFMTGGAFTPKARKFLESVTNEQIIKPFSLRELRSLVARHAAHA